MCATMTLLVALFVVLSSNDVISPALKGLALSYTIQVNPSLDYKAVISENVSCWLIYIVW